MNLYLSLWQRALASPAGLVIPTDDCRTLIRELYLARKASGDQALYKLQIVNKSAREVWIVHSEFYQRGNPTYARKRRTPKGNHQPLPYRR